jgi:hypothetical protein
MNRYYYYIYFVVVLNEMRRRDTVPLGGGGHPVPARSNRPACTRQPRLASQDQKPRIAAQATTGTRLGGATARCCCTRLALLKLATS